MKGTLEAEISAAIGKFLKEMLGRGPKQVKTKIYDDLLIIRVITYIDPLHKRLQECEQGLEIISKKRRILFNNAKEEAIRILKGYLKGVNIKATFYDSEVDCEETVVVFVAEENLEKILGLASGE